MGTADVWNLPEIDLTQTHRYGDEGSMKDVAPVILTDAREHDRYPKPHLMGEFGISWRNSDAKFDPTGMATNLHNGLWAGALSGDAGGAAIWWWDNYVHPRICTASSPAWRSSPRRWTGRAAASPRLPCRRRPAPALEPETFTDLVITPTAGWGDKAQSPVVVHPDGTVTGGPVLSDLYGPAKAGDAERPDPACHPAAAGGADPARRHRLQPQPSCGRLDGKTVGDFMFDADPAKGGGYQSTKQFPEYGGIYQALFNADRTVAVPAGPHVLTLENTEGDWLQLGSLTLTHALSSRYSLLRTAALQDPATGETLAWLQDPASNWDNDRAGTCRSLRSVSALRCPSRARRVPDLVVGHPARCPRPD